MGKYNGKKRHQQAQRRNTKDQINWNKEAQQTKNQHGFSVGLIKMAEFMVIQINSIRPDFLEPIEIG